MAYSIRRVALEPVILSAGSIVLTAVSCWLYFVGLRLPATISLILAICCFFSVVSYVRRLNKKFDYIVSATMNGDFSYKFPLNNCNEREKEVNKKLNMIVGHLEKLRDKTLSEERFLGEVINLIETGIIVADEKGHVMTCNQSARQILSLAVLTEIKQLPHDLPGVEIKKNNVVIDGKRVDIFTLSDINRMTQTVEVNSWEKLIRVLTHEILNSLTPVNSIVDSMTMSLRDKPASEDLADLIRQIEVIKSSNRNLMEFVRNFRKVAVVPEPVPQVIYIKPYLANIISLAMAFEGGEKIGFQLTVFPPETMVYTDCNLLRHVIVNLLKNGIESGARNIFMEAGIRDDERIEISITNDGELIPENILPQIFIPFFTTKSKGSGIGLSLSRQIVSRLGGTLTLTARPQTKFVITL